MNSDTTKNLRILFDHGGIWTMGDRAQTISAIESLKRTFPSCTIISKSNPIDLDLDMGQDAEYISPRAELEKVGSFTKWVSCIPKCWKISKILRYAGRCSTAFCTFFGAFTMRIFGLPLTPNKNLRSFLKELKQADFFVIAGNGGMTDVFFLGGLLSFGVEVIAAKIMKKPIVLTGQGIGPIDNPWAQRFAKFFFKKVNYLTVREAFSLELIKKIGATPKKYELAVDDAHTFKSNETSLTSAKALMANWPRPIISLNLREERYVETTDTFNEMIAKSVESLLAETGGTVICVPMQSEIEKDMALYEDLETKLHNPDHMHILPADMANPRTVKAIQEQVDIAVGSTYHVLLFALSAGVPALSIFFSDYYRQKLGGLMEQYHLPEGVIHGEKLTSETLTTEVLRMLKNKEALHQKLQIRNAELNALHKKTYAHIKELIGMSARSAK